MQTLFIETRSRHHAARSFGGQQRSLSLARARLVGTVAIGAILYSAMGAGGGLAAAGHEPIIAPHLAVLSTWIPSADKLPDQAEPSQECLGPTVASAFMALVAVLMGHRVRLVDSLRTVRLRL
ncbi:MAG TPA: hypothetical protein VG826_26150 [Pirellulales bacterium]|nr:hypothetical protein [Pirellulales bacterium]